MSDFNATHILKNTGDEYLAIAYREDGSDYQWGTFPLVPEDGESIALFSEEDWAVDSATYVVKPRDRFLHLRECIVYYNGGGVTDYKITDFKVISAT